MAEARKVFDTDLASIGLEVSANMEKGNGIDFALGSLSTLLPNIHYMNRA